MVNPIRQVLLLTVPLFMAWAFVSTLVREIGRAFRYAYLDARSELATGIRLWKEWSKW